VIAAMWELKLARSYCLGYWLTQRLLLPCKTRQ